MDNVNYELWQDDMMVVSVSGDRQFAGSEIRHYAFVYSQDGSVTIYRRDGRKRIKVTVSDTY